MKNCAHPPLLTRATALGTAKNDNMRSEGVRHCLGLKILAIAAEV